MDIIGKIKKNKIIPVAVFSNADDAVAVAEILLASSFDMIEVTLRTMAAFDCIEAINKRFPAMTVGAGSVQSKETLKTAYERGAVFGVAPGLDLEIVEYAKSLGMLFIPGVATPSELNLALRASDVIKVFPAEQLGGPAYLQAISAPFAMKKFFLIPTGGINEKNFQEYMKSGNVIACGMTYIVEKNLVDKKDFKTLEDRIKKFAAELSRS